jgi:cytochrome c oxidase subunit 2
MRVQGLLFGLATLVLVVAATAYFGREWLPPLMSDRAAIDSAIGVSLVVTGVVFIATNLLLAWFSWRYADDGAGRAAYWHDNARLEWTWTLATAGVMFLFLFKALGLWAEVQSPAPADALQVEVTGQQFRWVVRYPGPDGVFGKSDPRTASGDNEKAYIGVDSHDPASADDIVLVNTLYIPQDRPVRVRLRSTDVIHSFFLPQFRVKQDAMPGLTTETWFVPKGSGDFEIACAEHCGLGHYRMKGMVHVVPAAELDARVREAAGL